MGENVYLIFEESYQDYGHHLKSPVQFFTEDHDACREMDHLLLSNLKDALSYSSLVEFHKKSLFHIIEKLYHSSDEESGKYNYVLGDEKLVVTFTCNCIEIFLYKEMGSDYMHRIQLKRIYKHIIDTKPYMLLCAGVNDREFAAFDILFFSSFYEASSFMYCHYHDNLDLLKKELVSSRKMIEDIEKEIDQTILQGQEVISSYNIEDKLLMCFMDETQCYMDLSKNNENCIYTMEIMQLPH